MNDVDIVIENCNIQEEIISNVEVLIKAAEYFDITNVELTNSFWEAHTKYNKSVKNLSAFSDNKECIRLHEGITRFESRLDNLIGNHDDIINKINHLAENIPKIFSNIEDEVLMRSIEKKMIHALVNSVRNFTIEHTKEFNDFILLLYTAYNNINHSKTHDQLHKIREKLDHSLKRYNLSAEKINAFVKDINSFI